MFVLQTLENKVSRNPGHTPNYIKRINELFSLIPHDVMISLTGGQTVFIQGVIIRREVLHLGTMRVSPVPVQPNGAQLIVRPDDLASGMLVILRTPHWMKIESFIEALTIAVQTTEPKPSNKGKKEKEVKNPLQLLKRILGKPSPPAEEAPKTTEEASSPQERFLQEILNKGTSDEEGGIIVTRKEVLEIIRTVYKCAPDKEFDTLSTMRRFYTAHRSANGTTFRFDSKLIAEELARK